MENRSPSRWNEQIYHQACEWFVEFRTGEPSEAARRIFHAWLQETPAHMAAYLEVAAIWQDSEVAGSNPRWQPELLIEQARGEPDNVVPMPSVDFSPRFREEGGEQTPPAEHSPCAAQVVSPKVRPGMRIVLTMAASVLLMAGATAVWLYVERGTFTTGTGEQRSIALADGSTVQLNSQSKVRVRFSGSVRRVDLLRGQALFQVNRDPRRPFVVSSEETRVRAVGTEFDVYRKESGTIVTVIEGRVAVASLQRPLPDLGSAGSASAARIEEHQGGTGTHLRKDPLKSPSDRTDVASAGSAGPKRLPDGAAPAEILLDAGEQIALTGKGQPAPRPINVSLVTAWTKRQLAFESTPLPEVAEEFNRYNERQILIRSGSLHDFEVDGIFSSTDPASLIRFLRSRPGVLVTETDSEIIITSN